MLLLTWNIFIGIEFWFQLAFQLIDEYNLEVHESKIYMTHTKTIWIGVPLRKNKIISKRNQLKINPTLLVINQSMLGKPS